MLVRFNALRFEVSWSYYRKPFHSRLFIIVLVFLEAPGSKEQRAWADIANANHALHLTCSHVFVGSSQITSQRRYSRWVCPHFARTVFFRPVNSKPIADHVIMTTRWTPTWRKHVTASAWTMSGSWAPCILAQVVTRVRFACFASLACTLTFCARHNWCSFALQSLTVRRVLGLHCNCTVSALSCFIVRYFDCKTCSLGKNAEWWALSP